VVVVVVVVAVVRILVVVVVVRILVVVVVVRILVVVVVVVVVRILVVVKLVEELEQVMGMDKDTVEEQDKIAELEEVQELLGRAASYPLADLHLRIVEHRSRHQNQGYHKKQDRHPWVTNCRSH